MSVLGFILSDAKFCLSYEKVNGKLLQNNIIKNCYNNIF